ncbi:DUF642 domain-containing protein [Patescibacteria group bacterium]|nr:DUF642 domain-containing protein [Patescibacteria group bacterium]
MNSFITPTVVGVRTVAFITMFALTLSVLPASVFVAAAEDVVDPTPLLIDGNPSPTEPGESPDPVAFVFDIEDEVIEGEASTTDPETETGVPPQEDQPLSDELLVEAPSSTDPEMETEVPPQEEEVPVTEAVLECNVEANLIENGSFEVPVLDEDGFGWDVFPSELNGLAWIVEWLFPSDGAPKTPVLELQGGYFTPADGDQYAELDSNYNPAPGGEYNGEQAGVRILQTIPTIPGYTYTVSYQFSPKPGYDADSNVLVAKVDGVVKGTHSADGSELSDTNWTPYTYTFVATDSEAVVSFEDAGTQDTFGTLIDAVSVNCAGRDDDDDDSEDDVFTLSLALTGEGFGGVTDGELEGIICSTNGGEANDCSHTYASGTVVTLTVTPAEGSNFDNSWTVGGGTCTGNTTPCTVTMTQDYSLTAHFDLNDVRTGGGGGGGRRSNRDNTNLHEAPEGQVLGEQVTAVPYGAPDTGAGGAATFGGQTILSFLYVASRRVTVKK